MAAMLSCQSIAVLCYMQGLPKCLECLMEAYLEPPYDAHRLPKCLECLMEAYLRAEPPCDKQAWNFGALFYGMMLTVSLSAWNVWWKHTCGLSLPVINKLGISGHFFMGWCSPCFKEYSNLYLTSTVFPKQLGPSSRGRMLSWTLELKVQPQH